MKDRLSLYDLRMIGIPTIPFEEIITEDQLTGESSLVFSVIDEYAGIEVCEETTCHTKKQQQEFVRSIRRVYGEDVTITAFNQSELIDFVFTINNSDVRLPDSVTDDQKAIAYMWCELINENCADTGNITCFVSKTADGEYVMKSMAYGKTALA